MRVDSCSSLDDCYLDHDERLIAWKSTHAALAESYYDFIVEFVTGDARGISFSKGSFLLGSGDVYYAVCSLEACRIEGLLRCIELVPAPTLSSPYLPACCEDLLVAVNYATCTLHDITSASELYLGTIMDGVLPDDESEIFCGTCLDQDDSSCLVYTKLPAYVVDLSRQLDADMDQVKQIFGKVLVALPDANEFVISMNIFLNIDKPVPDLVKLLERFDSIASLRKELFLEYICEDFGICLQQKRWKTLMYLARREVALFESPGTLSHVFEKVALRC